MPRCASRLLSRSTRHGAALLCVVVIAGIAGCGLPSRSIDASLALRARSSIVRVQTEASYDEDDGAYEDEEKSVFVAQLLAIFPGFFVHGLGHSYAGDYSSARRLRNMGQWGYLFTGLGAGIGVGAYFLDQSSDSILPISLYVAGGGVGAVGLGYFFTAWILDIYDTPRAVRTGGRPWRFLQKEGEIFD